MLSCPLESRAAGRWYRPRLRLWYAWLMFCGFITGFI